MPTETATEPVLPFRPAAAAGPTSDPPGPTPLLVGGREAARMIGLSNAGFYRLRASGGFGPTPIKLGGRVLFRVSEITEWVSANCPDRRAWLASRAVASRAASRRFRPETPSAGA
jgi:predicted DNA-binding transcriptional regulator AlpA